MRTQRLTGRAATVAITGVLSIALLVTVGATSVAALPPAVVAGERDTEPQEVKSVPGHDARLVMPASKSFPERGPAKVDWPAAETAEVTIPAGQTRSAIGTQAGNLPVWLAAGGERPAEKAMNVTVELLSRAESERRGVDGVVLKLRRGDGLTSPVPVRMTVGYNSFRDAYGGDWSSRLRLRPADKADTLPVTAVRNDLATGRLTADVMVGQTDRMVVLAAASEGSAGDYKATSLSPAGRWAGSIQGGELAWNQEFRTPPVPGGLKPSVAASYSSSAIDGKVATTNNQPSWIGEGWGMSTGFLERAYKRCADDLGGNNGQNTEIGDLCWETDNATLSLGEHSSQLVFENGTWRLKNDDGTRIDRLEGAENGGKNGQYWRVTTTDGTQYFFGLNRLPNWTEGKPTTNSAWNVPVFGNDPGEPCYESTFDASQCTQTYRWNLDYVVDPQQNAMAYFYTPETNRYGVNLAVRGVFYTRGGTLARIEYGFRRGAEYAAPAPARVVFESDDRCKAGTTCTIHNAESWPDVPWDTECTTGTCPGKYSPTFWSTKRLSKITTQISTGGGYRGVDQWTFAHAWPEPGDGTTAGLYLTGITHTGLAAGSVVLPATTFEGIMMANRVYMANGDNLPALNKYRITTIKTETGAAINVNYLAPDCTQQSLPASADQNTKRCFPVRWNFPPATTPMNDWFHKYAVAQVVEDDLVGGNKDMVTNYEYLGGAAWAYDDDPLVKAENRTWSQWRGFEKVAVRKGDPTNDANKPESRVLYQHFRGMNGDRTAMGGTKTVNIIDSAGTVLPDAEPLSGFLREQIAYDGTDGGEQTGTINDPWYRLTATQGSVKAYQVETGRTTERVRLTGGNYRRTQVDTTYDAHGNATQVKDLGDLADVTDDRCTTSTYVKNEDAWIMNLASRVQTVAVPCGTTPNYPQDAITDTRLHYDDQPWGSAPVRGSVTKTETAKDYSAGQAVYLATSQRSYDDYGRITATVDAKDRRTTTEYVEMNGLTTTTRLTNPLGHTTTTTLDPAWSLPTSTEDANGRTTTMTYDGLGRLLAVWKPDRSKAGGDGPNIRHTYSVRRDGPTWVRTERLRANGNMVGSYVLYDGFLRERQTQQPSPQPGRVIADTLYDSRGLVNVSRAPYYNSDAEPDTQLFLPEPGRVPSTTVAVYDGTERQTAAIQLGTNDVERWRTTTSYGGNSVTVTPPAGGTKTTTISDARGRTTELRQYKSDTAYDQTTYTYTNRDEQASIRDAAGNQWTFEYDLLGRKVRTVDPDQGETRMAYDEVGQLLTTTDARGKVVAAKYDDLGRRTETRQQSETGPLIARWTYDTLAKGQFTSSTRFVNGNAYTRAITGYDRAGRPTGESVTIPASEPGLNGTYTTSTIYSADGSPSSVALPKLGDVPAETLNYDYNDLGALDSLTGATTYVASISYTALEERSQVEFGMSGKRVWEKLFYEEGTRRLVQQQVDREYASQRVVNVRQYAYDPVGNVMKVSDQATGTSIDMQCFGYDYLRRVTQAWTASGECSVQPTATTIGGPAPYWHQYEYDLSGNRTKQVSKGVAGLADVVSTYTYPGAGSPRSHSVQSITTGANVTDFSYDAAGNTTAMPGPVAQQSLTWTDDGLLDSIGTTAGATQYVYDADGTQLVRRDPGRATLFLGGGELTVDTATGVKKGTRHYEGMAIRSGGKLSWISADRHGTAQLAIDQSTLAVTMRRQDLFGNPRNSATWPGGTVGFVGGLTNTGTGLTRLGAREYSAQLGRFLSADPILDPENPQQLNAYAYAGNSPATWSDPSGLIADYDDCRCNYNGNRAKIDAAAKKIKGGLNNATWREEKRNVKEHSRAVLAKRRGELREAAAKAALQRAIDRGPGFWETMGIVADVGLTLGACAATAGAGCVVRGLVFVAATTIASEVPPRAVTPAAASPNYRVNWPEGHGPVDLSKTYSEVGMPREGTSFTGEMTTWYKYQGHVHDPWETRIYDANGKIVESNSLRWRSRALGVLRVFGRIFG
ncbi:RHS repeat-associated core domain-containing protein [Kribbella sp. NPDC003505]|uniref:RHS repeat-associated core domain-containing protein n=1 Tax=Kribbella sp. NPDC003505 TaxID=3154448 RepID=UPI0033AC5E1E